ncbi:MAG: hypothetical protein M3008_05850 [Chloroflexota bacterium]|nr:hypothetical protein [Chloroflexota bacterium]
MRVGHQHPIARRGRDDAHQCPGPPDGRRALPAAGVATLFLLAGTGAPFWLAIGRDAKRLARK